MEKVINLSFDDSHLTISRVDGVRTVATMRSYFSVNKLQKFFEEFGFEVLPDVVRNILKKYGYKYDYNLNGWCVFTKGVTTLVETDTDNQIKANRIALTKAKSNAYRRATKVMSEIYDTFVGVGHLLYNSKENLSYIRDAEYVGLDNVKETGFCDPKYVQD